MKSKSLYSWTDSIIDLSAIVMIDVVFQREDNKKFSYHVYTTCPITKFINSFDTKEEAQQDRGKLIQAWDACRSGLETDEEITLTKPTTAIEQVEV